MRSVLVIMAVLSMSLSAYAAGADFCKRSPFETKLGFSPWPSDLTLSGVDRGYQFIEDNGNIILHHFDNGVPWVAALGHKPYGQHLQNEWADRLSRSPKDTPIILALTPISFGRNGLAMHWNGDGEGQNLPTDWEGKKFDDSDVIKAFGNYVLKAVAYFRPSYLAIGIETNILISNSPDEWLAYLKLNAAVYEMVKLKYPNLVVFSSIQYEHLRGIEDDSKKNAHLQISSVTKLLEHSDLLGLSTYRYGDLHPNPPIDGFFDVAKGFGKQIAIVESGGLSKTITLNDLSLTSSDQTQFEFVRMLLMQAQKLKFPFLINWVNVDFDGTLEKLPVSIQDTASPWVYTGLEYFSGQAKPILKLWKSCLK